MICQTPACRRPPRVELRTVVPEVGGLVAEYHTLCLTCATVMANWAEDKDGTHEGRRLDF